MTDENREEIVEFDAEQLEELINGADKLPPIEIGLEDFEIDEFKRGIHETSYLAGVITALFNSGVTESFILDYLLNQETIKHNLMAAEITRDMNVEMSKNQRLVAEKNEL